MSGPCIKCGHEARYSVDNVFQHKGKCPPLPAVAEQTYVDASQFPELDAVPEEVPTPQRMVVTEVRPEPAPEPEPLPEPEPEPVPEPVAVNRGRGRRPKPVTAPEPEPVPVAATPRPRVRRTRRKAH